MAINFPNSPVDGEIFYDNISGNRFVFESAKSRWKAAANASIEGATVTISNTAPALSSVGDLWWNQEYGRLLIYYNDGDSYQWVDSSPSSDYDVIYNFANTVNTFSYSVSQNTTAAFNHANSSFDRANNSVYRGYFNSTIYALPTGDYQGTDTYVGQTQSLDAFGVPLVTSFDCMNPAGSLETVDLGSV